MAIYIVTYDVYAQDRLLGDKLSRAIKEFANISPSESTFLVQYKGETKALFDYLKKNIDDEDSIFVFRLRADCCGYGRGDVLEWIEKAKKIGAF